jgi:ABC-type polysaccharide/polyol phosphate export permease
VRLVNDIKKFSRYAWYNAVAELKAQVAESYLGWLWWILDPLLFMFVYSFVFVTIRGGQSNIEHFPLFVFIGLTFWNFFASTVQSSVNVIRSYRAVLMKTYIPKFILVLMLELVNLIKMMIGLGLSIVIMAFLRIPFTVHMLEVIPILFVYIILTFGMSLVVAHIGVYIADFNNIITVVLRLLFYLSGVFFTLDAFEGKVFFGQDLLSIYNMIIPTGFIIKQFREVLMYGYGANYSRLLYWLIGGIILTVIGLYLTYKHENNYMKVL